MNYDDIIGLPHHVSRRHKQMSLLNRAAQFAPFAALTGYEDAIIETSRITDKEIELENDRMVLLDLKLNQLRQLIETQTNDSNNITITYFVRDTRKEGGSYQTINTRVKCIDETQRAIKLLDGSTIEINDIIDLSIGS